MDIFGITLPVVKHSFIVNTSTELPRVVHEAFRIARIGRPGPVLIDLPKDIANTVSDYPIFTSQESEETPAASADSVARALELMKASKKPVIYAGGGIGLADAVEDFRKFVDVTRIPVVATLKGLGVVPAKHELFLGMMGMHGMKAANHAVQESRFADLHRRAIR